MDLSELITGIERTFHVSVCVHDVSGVTYLNTALQLDYQHKSHSCAYCGQVKALLSKAACMRQKQIVMRHLRITGGQPFFGTCYMGVSEYVLPVTKDGKLLCVIFVSGAAREALQTAARKRAYSLLDSPKSAPVPDYSRFCQDFDTSQDTMLLLAKIIEDKISACLPPSDMTGLNANSPESTWQAITPAPSRSSSWLIKDFLPYIQENYRTKITLRLLSDVFFINPQYLSRIFTQQIGQSLSKYINALRMRQAAMELLTSNRSIAEIASGLGIDDANYFYRLFKATYQMTAREYRNRYRKQSPE